MKALAYIRVSTREQDEEVQKNAIESFAQQRGIEILKWYVDKASGAIAFKNRESAKELLKDIDLLKPDLVIAWSLDRLGRNMLDTTSVVLELENKGVKIVTVKEEFLQTLDQSIRKLFLSIFSWIAEFERLRMRERQLEAWRQGKQKGRPKKISDELLLKYYNDYVVKKGLSLMDVCRLLNASGHKISYETVKKRIKKLKEEGRIKVKIVVKQ